MEPTRDANKSRLSIECLKAALSHIDANPLLAEPAEFADLRLGIKDDEHEYRIAVSSGTLCSIDVDANPLSHPVDVKLVASSFAWSQYLTEVPPPAYSDLLGMMTEGYLSIVGDTTKFFQHMTFITNLMRELGHRLPLTVANGARKPSSPPPHGHIEDAVGRYVHLHLDGHDYRIFYEETVPPDGIPVVLLHAANTDARMWRHQLSDPALARRYRLIAFDMPWRGRSAPPPELLRTEYRLSNSLYRRTIRAFCDALNLDKPILVGCSMGGYICFYCAHEDAGRYRGFVAAACRDYEPRRWLMESVFRHPAVSFNRILASLSAGFMAPQDPPEHADMTAWLYESGSPRTLRGDLGFASLDCDARPFMDKIDTKMYPFYVLGGEYDWSCSEEHTKRIEERMKGVKVLRMKDIGHFPPDEIPKVFNHYLAPVLEDIVQNSQY